MRAALAAAALVLVATAGAHAWDERVVHREVLAVDRPVVELGPLLASGEGPARVELRGTITSFVDGTTFDAVSRWDGEVRLRDAEPLLAVPSGARLVEEDPAAHRYVLEVPRSANARLELAVRRLAHEHFLTPSELGARTTGVIEVLVLERVPETAAVATDANPDSGPAVPLAALATGAAAPPLLFALLLGLSRRRRARPECALVRRAARAVRAIEREVARLGPAFEDVAATARRIRDGAEAARRHVDQVRAALRRTRHLTSEGAVVLRLDLREAEEEALARLNDLVDRLESTATRLAARTASQSRPDIARLLADLDSDLDTSLTADTEAFGDTLPPANPS